MYTRTLFPDNTIFCGAIVWRIGERSMAELFKTFLRWKELGSERKGDYQERKNWHSNYFFLFMCVANLKTIN